MARDPLRTRLCEEYGCEYPIVAFSLTREVVAAATNAGAIGVYGASPLEPEQLRSDIRWIHDQVGERPFGIDTLLPASFEAGNPEDLEARIPAGHRGFVEELQREHGIPDPKSPGPWKAILGAELLTRVRRQVDVILDERVPIFASGLGSPMLLADRAREVGTSLWGLVGAPRQARREIEAGIDVVVAQGADSGGHSGRIGTFSLVPAVTRLASGSSTLVVAAGGVTTGQHLAAALTLGADGVWCGTIWQTTEESDVDPALKQRLLDAQTEDAIKTSALTGKPGGGPSIEIHGGVGARGRAGATQDAAARHAGREAAARHRGVRAARLHGGWGRQRCRADRAHAVHTASDRGSCERGTRDPGAGEPHELNASG